MTTRTKILQMSALAAVLTIASSQATFIANPVGIVAPTTIDFTEVVLANGTALTTQYSAYGLTFAGMFYNTQPITSGGVTAPVAENFQPITNPFSLFFSTVQTSADFNFITNTGEVTLFQAYLGGVLQDSGVAATSISDVNFYGFTGDNFDEIRITVSNNINGAAALDNVQFNGTGQVPDAGSTLALFGLGIGALALGSRRLARS